MSAPRDHTPGGGAKGRRSRGGSTLVAIGGGEHREHRSGGTIAGTSAGAAAMAETMLTGGSSNGGKPSGDIAMAPGLGLLLGVVVDTHFGQRGRMDRLLRALAQNPGYLGIGLDEDTA